MYKDMTSKAQRLGWFQSRFVVKQNKVNWLNVVTSVAIVGVVAIIVGQLIRYNLYIK